MPDIVAERSLERVDAGEDGVAGVTGAVLQWVRLGEQHQQGGER
jgi:hypothetical protein